MYPTLFSTPGVKDFAEAVDAERQQQLAKWGDQRHPDGTGRPGDRAEADRMRAICQANNPEQDNWRDIAAEEWAEACAETEWPKLRAELVQLSSVLAAWISDGDRRTQAAPEPAICEGFRWIGQSFACCDRCGLPAWEHVGEDIPVNRSDLFDSRRTVRPWEPGEADRIRAKWQPAS